MSESSHDKRAAVIEAATRRQHSPADRVRAPVGVIGPREVTPAQYALAEAVGAGLARMGCAVICGGRGGVMEAVCKGVASEAGVSIGMLPEPDADAANAFVTHVIATGIGEARNAIIARAAFCLVAIGNSFGTLSEVALGRQFGKLVIGLGGAAQVDGVVMAESVEGALELVAKRINGTRHSDRDSE